MAIMEHGQNGNQKECTTEASQQDKPWKERRACADLPTLHTAHKLPHNLERANWFGENVQTGVFVAEDENLAKMNWNLSNRREDKCLGTHVVLAVSKQHWF